MIYLYLFVVAFISATLFPMGSEALLVLDINSGYNIYFLVFVATFGNTLGSILNYYLGLKGEEYLLRKKIIKIDILNRAKIYFDRYGTYSLLFSWLPIIGDPLTFVAGIFQYNIKKFILVVFIAKFSRYCFLAFGYLYYLK